MYTVNNAQVFAAAFGGALSAFGASAPQGSTFSGNYIQQSNAALAVAEAVDTAWGGNPCNAMDFSSIGVATGLVLRDRGVFPITPAFSNASNWTSEGQAIVALVLSGDAIASSAGITFPTIQTGNGDDWPYNAYIAGSIRAPLLGQQQATYAGTTDPIIIKTADAMTGSGMDGGALLFDIGKCDTVNLPSYLWRVNTALDGSTNIGVARLSYNPGAVCNFVLGLGTNGVGAGIAGVEISAYTELSLATEGGLINCHAIRTPPGLDSNWVLQPMTTDGTNEAGFLLTTPVDHATSGDGSALQVNATVTAIGTGVLRYLDVQNSATRRWDVQEHGGYANLTTYETDGVTSGTAGAFYRIPWGNSTSYQSILSQYSLSLAAPVDILSRNVDEIYFGSYSETNRYHTSTRTLFECFSPGNGWMFENYAGNEVFSIRSDAGQTIARGTPDVGGKDGYLSPTASYNSATTGAITIATISLINNAITQLQVRIVAMDTVTNDFATFTISSGYKKVAGTITAPTAAAVVVDTGHSTAAAGVSPTFTVSGGNIQVGVTSWSADNIHWYVFIEQFVNVGTY